MTINPQEAISQTPERSRVVSVHRTAKMIVLAMALSIAAYAVIGLMIVRTSNIQSEPAQLPIPFAVGAIFLALGSIALRRAQMRGVKLQAIMGAGGVEALLKHFLNVTVITAALADLIGILGLLASLFGGGWRYVVIFGAVALLVLFRNYPSRRAWQQAVDYFVATTPGAAAKQ